MGKNEAINDQLGLKVASKRCKDFHIQHLLFYKFWSEELHFEKRPNKKGS
jgi:hypothetical protein